ncbi:small nuclear RNA activating complex, polypeptide 3 [Entophlyctis sp. JEL0112]|nr:small nuclear RNA activating complex, polypeptide 3 [Entophlyctis sp. JEL0112]
MYEVATVPSNHAAPLSASETVVTVAFFAPQSPHSTFNSQFTILTHTRVLGSNTISDLRDACVDCVADRITVSVAPQARRVVRPSSVQLDGQGIVRGFFFIEGIFYDDSRVIPDEAYSRAIVDWVNADEARKMYFTKDGKRGVKSKKMQECRIADLTVRLNQPYLYVHQGACEHVVMFREIRYQLRCEISRLSICLLLTGNISVARNYGSQMSNVYAHNRNVRGMMVPQLWRLTLCFVISTLFDCVSDRRMSMDDERVPLNPFFWCVSCFTGFHTASQPAYVDIQPKKGP